MFKRIFLVATCFLNITGVPQDTAKKESIQPIPLVIIGSGVAGLSAGLFGRQLGIPTTLITGPLKGGLLTQTSSIENYPGVKKIEAHLLVETMLEQNKDHGVDLVEDTVVSVDFTTHPFAVDLETGKTLYASSLILATGSTPRLLGVPGEKRYFGGGISTCAICDGRFFQNKDVVIVGGGDAAIEEALQLIPHVKSIRILVRNDRMRAAYPSQQRLKNSPKIKSIEYNKIVTRIIGNDENVTALEVLSTKTGRKSIVPTDGLFLAIGHTPNSALFENKLALSDSGNIILEGADLMSSVPGVFAAGDVVDPKYRLAAVASGSGVMAAVNAAQWLRHNQFIKE